jgi:hypothetical protein
MAGKAKPSSKPAPKITVNRNAGTGQFVTDKYAKSHPKTTETERYKRGK